LVVASATASAVPESRLADHARHHGLARRRQRRRRRRGDGQSHRRARLGLDLDTAATLARVTTSEEAARTLALGTGHVHPDDIVFATRMDAFDIAMELSRVGERPRLIAG
jgi:hypothetical protein